MLSEATLACEDDLIELFRFARIQTGPEDMSPKPITERFYETDAYARALQALRDVRHLLPPEGVAIVDAVLDRAF